MKGEPSRKRLMVIGSTDMHPERAIKMVKFLEVLSAVSSDLVLVSSGCPSNFLNRFKWIKVFSPKKQVSNSFGRRFLYFLGQTKVSIQLIRHYKDYDAVIALGQFVFPIIIARALGKKPIRYHGGPNPRFLQPKPGILLMEAVANKFSFKIAVPSPSCVDHFDLRNFAGKVEVGFFHVAERFFIETVPFCDKPKNIAYFGNLTRFQGGARAVDNLIEGFLNIKNRLPEYRLVLGGAGPVEVDVEKMSPGPLVLKGWIDHNDLGAHLDNVRLLILPSKTEGLATIILEAMARGTLVLATAVGGTKDIVFDGKTGFLMENTDPKCIGENILRALTHPEVEDILENARRMVESKYAFGQTKVAWQEILNF
jgi:glycosyltransferase involved in cell wall biosynthesis